MLAFFKGAYYTCSSPALPSGGSCPLRTPPCLHLVVEVGVYLLDCRLQAVEMVVLHQGGNLPHTLSQLVQIFLTKGSMIIQPICQISINNNRAYLCRNIQPTRNNCLMCGLLNYPQPLLTQNICPNAPCWVHFLLSPLGWFGPCPQC